MQPVVNITHSIGHTFDWQNAKFWEVPARRAAIIARFWLNVNRAEAKGCWPYLGYVGGHGYGVIGIGTAPQLRVRAHRFVWFVLHGHIPADQVVCHTCDNPRCVNPAHLLLASQAENVHDSSRKGRKNAWGVQKLNAEQVYQIRARAARGEPNRNIAADFGIARNTVSQIVHRKTWAHLVDVPGARRQAAS